MDNLLVSMIEEHDFNFSPQNFSCDRGEDGGGGCDCDVVDD